MIILVIHNVSVQEVECSHAKVFIQELVAATASLLSLFDSVIPTSEVIPGSECNCWVGTLIAFVLKFTTFRG